MPHRDDCCCADCVEGLRHDLDRAQAQALALLDEMAQSAGQLRQIADRLSRHCGVPNEGAEHDRMDG